MVKKMNAMLRDLKESKGARFHTFFQSNGLALKQGEKIVHSLNAVNRSNV